jgi:hypothetical protein
MLHVQAPDELTDMMRPIVSQLQLPKAQYNPSKYPNPGKCFILSSERHKYLPDMISSLAVALPHLAGTGS